MLLKDFDKISSQFVKIIPKEISKLLASKGISIDDFDYAQNHLRILSGLYGLLRPLDLIQPYRLEMGTKIDNPSGKNLYQFWGSKISEGLQKTLKKHNS